MNKILVVGSINMDLTIRTPRWPKPGETLFGEGFSTQPGGKGANQAEALGRLGAEVRMLGRVGHDAFGEVCREHLKKGGVGVEGVREAATTTGVAVITVSGGENHILLERGANFSVTPSEVQKEQALFEWADVIVLQFEIPMESVVCAAKLAKSLGKKVLVNPAPMTEIPEELIQNIDYFIPNQHEAGAFLGMEITSLDDAYRALSALREKGIPNSIITLGEMGSVYHVGDALFHQPAFQTKAVDTTAAGDCFVAALLRRLGEGKTLPEAVRYATAASSIAVSRKGASDSLPSGEEVEKRLQEEAK